MNKKNIAVSVIIVLIIILAGIFNWNSNTQESDSSALDINQSISQDKTDLIEIFYLSHAPAEDVVQQIEPIISKFPQYTIVKYDFEDASNTQLLEEYGITEHLPVAIFIEGENTFIIDGESVTLENFPAGNAFSHTEDGWSYEQLEEILTTKDNQ